MVKIKHLQQIHDLKSYRNACRVVKQLEPFIHETFHNKSKIIYLNKQGRELIGSANEVKKTPLIDHVLLTNEVYTSLDCPYDWKKEVHFELEEKKQTDIEIKVLGAIKMSNKKKVIADATFTRNGYLNIVEIDNTRKMLDNKKKIEMYAELFRLKKDCVMKLLFFTTTNDRKRKFEGWLQDYKIRGEVVVFDDLE